MIEIRRQRLVGSNHVRHAIYVDGVELPGAQLSPFSDAEIEARVRSFVNPSAAIPYVAPEIIRGAKAKGSKGGKAKRQRKVTAQGFRWEQESET